MFLMFLYFSNFTFTLFAQSFLQWLSRVKAQSVFLRRVSTAAFLITRTRLHRYDVTNPLPLPNPPTSDPRYNPLFFYLYPDLSYHSTLSEYVLRKWVITVVKDHVSVLAVERYGHHNVIIQQGRVEHHS